ncbi:Zinc finger protein [Armadillidium nasatum]|uniref:Zinc finger protein n=1 Tax=Armadillidium nasatum TaxID=96803 RepID=A0A5N5SK83_9CRUS|nr:Zinc finger protein [Armadillidium nasatum]
MENDKEDKTCICPVCSKSFTKLSSLKDHLSIHSGIKSFQCTECNISFRKEKYLKNHMSLHTGQYLYFCPVCRKGINDKHRFEEHKLTHAGTKPHSCNVCSRSFYFYATYKRHMRSSCHKNFYIKKDLLKSNANSCSICYQDFDNVYSLRNHMRAHADANPFLCKLCGKTFKYKKHLKSHLKDHNFQCTKCPVQFKSVVAYNDHMKRHNGGFLYTCYACKKTFSKSSNLIAHENIHKSNSQKFYCDYCKTEFSQLGNLSRHLKKNTDRDSYSCSKCSSKFETGCLLRKHLQIHSESSIMKVIVSSSSSDVDDNQKDIENNFKSDTNTVSKYQCTLCCKPLINVLNAQNAYCSKYELSRHKNKHLGIKPFKCEQCHKTYYKKNSLNTHMAVHSAIKPFSCQYCKTQYCQKIGLKRHLNKNTGKEPYLCNLCPSLFESQCLLKNHSSLSHKNKSSSKALSTSKEKLEDIQNNCEFPRHLYHCSYCDNKFAQSSIYQKHLQCHKAEINGIREKRHMSEKLLVCCRCLKRFSNNLSLLEHHCPKSPEHEKQFWDFIHSWSLSFENHISNASSEIKDEIFVDKET